MLVPPYDDALIIAGQGTAGREIVEDLARARPRADIVVVTASGGGLTAGIALARQGARAAARDLYRRAGRLRRSRPLVSQRPAREQCGADRHDLRCADGADAGRDHLCHQQRAGRRRASW